MGRVFVHNTALCNLRAGAEGAGGGGRGREGRKRGDRQRNCDFIKVDLWLLVAVVDISYLSKASACSFGSPGQILPGLWQMLANSRQLAGWLVKANSNWQRSQTEAAAGLTVVADLAASGKCRQVHAACS